MELIDRIEKKGLEVLEQLRFPIQFLEIFYNGIWKKIPILNSYESSFKLEMILFDTGNTAPYCEISDIYLTSFDNEFPGIEYFLRNGKTLTEVLLFRFNDLVEFKSQIGFTQYTPDTRPWRDRININFDSITQFLSIICTSNSSVKNRIFYTTQSLDNLVEFD